MLCIEHVILNLIEYAKDELDLSLKDVDYKTNCLFDLLKVNVDIKNLNYKPEKLPLNKLLDDLVEVGVNNKLFELCDSEYYLDQVMGLLSMEPSMIQNKFDYLKKESKEAATNWFYNYSVKNDYVKKAKLDQNPRFDSKGLVITINKAKPEFRDSKKAASGNSVKGGYPLCSICHQNEGFSGRNKRTLRTIDVNLKNHKWFWQYSPYGYFKEHGILVNYDHTPMHVDSDTFENLMAFVDEFPHYFIGCNAALPRIGGSVLAHDHYQGGGEILPIFKREAYKTFINKDFPECLIEVVDWPGSVVRIVSNNKDDIINISTFILNAWRTYENKELNIIPFDEEGLHSAVSPTLVKTSRGYEMSIIFRNNCVSEEYPDGIFHAHPEYHTIKKESIGLIEAQGLFILPGRLENELGTIKHLIHNNQELTEELIDYQWIYESLISKCNKDYSLNNIDLAIKDLLGEICNNILDNTAVFKDKNDLIKFLEEHYII